MATTFSSVITDEAVSYARAATQTPGWYLIPKRWGISEVKGNLDVSRKYEDMNTEWITQTFSAIYNKDNNKLGHSVVIPPNPANVSTETNIGEIYFVYEDYFGNEFLFAVAQPDSPLTFTPGTGQGFLFEFTLNNISVPETFNITYTYPQDIEDHNNDMNAHAELLASLSTLDIKYDESKEMLIFTGGKSSEGST